MLTLKIRSRSPKSNQIFKPSQCYNICSLARIRHLVHEIGSRQAFLKQFENFKVLLWPWKWGKSHRILITFPPSQSCVCASLVKIHPFVQEIECRQGATRTRTPTGSAPKAICPFGSGYIILQDTTIEIKHDFLRINICWASREVLKPEPERLRFQYLPRGPADINISEKHIWSLFNIALTIFSL